MARHSMAQRDDHLEALHRVFGYLKHHCQCCASTTENHPALYGSLTLPFVLFEVEIYICGNRKSCNNRPNKLGPKGLVYIGNVEFGTNMNQINNPRRYTLPDAMITNRIMFLLQ